MLQTTCPNCNAQFKVQPEQLNIRQGRVMCGRCRHVFNAFQFLERVTETIPSASPKPAPATELAEPAAEIAASSITPSPLETFEFEISEPLKTVQAQADAVVAAQKASADAFEESLNSIIDAQTNANNSGATSYAMGQTTTFSESTPAAAAWPAPEPTPPPAPPPAVKVIAEPVVDNLATPSPIHAAVQAKMDMRTPAAPITPAPEVALATVALPADAADSVPTIAPPVVAVTTEPAVSNKSIPLDLRSPQNHTQDHAVALDDVVRVDTQVADDERSATNPLLEPLQGSDAKPASRAWVTALYALGCLLLFVVLAAQLAYHFRDVLVAQFPAQRGLALQACAKLNCVLPWSRNLDAVKIEASDLLEIPGKPGQLVLSATLANRSAVMLDYPLFEVMLTDNTNRTVTSRVFTPQQYLARALKPDEGFAPNTEIALTLNLDAGVKSLASGYNMQVVY